MPPESATNSVNIRAPRAEPSREPDRMTAMEIAELPASKRAVVGTHEHTRYVENHLECVRDERDEWKTRCARFEEPFEDYVELRTHNTQLKVTTTITVVAMAIAGALVGTSIAFLQPVGWGVLVLASLYQLGWTWAPGVCAVLRDLVSKSKPSKD